MADPRRSRTKRNGSVRDTSPAKPRYSLLDEPLLGIETTSGERRGATLPEVLALLGRDQIRAFTAMQAHQQHGWHAFTVQLACIALHHAAESDPRQSEQRWRELLVALTRSEEAWCLVVEDLARPAFMQPPVPEGTLDIFKDSHRYPDELDVLVTAKNHDVKAARIARPQLEHWIYALVTLQTMQGYSGKLNYGIARMNGGQASRAIIGLAPDLSPGSRFRRDVQVVLEARDVLAREHGYRRRGGPALLWCEEWTGVDSFALADLDPLFIEVCRRVRLVLDHDHVIARRATTEAERVASKELKGNTGDPWAPVNRDEAKSFTATEAGFTYRVIQRLLSDEFQPGIALVPREREGELLLVATVLARGQGKTAGFHERVLPIPRKVATMLKRPDSRAELGRIAKDRVDLVATVQNKVLRPSLKVLFQGGPEKLKQDDHRPERWVVAHDTAIDAEFFEHLWADLGRDAEDAARAWARRVIELARTQLDAAIESFPVPSARRYRAIAAAERVFEGAARKHVSVAYPPREVEHAH